MRILQIHPFLASADLRPLTGRASRIAQNLTGFLLDHGHEVAVYPWPEGLWGEPARLGFGRGRAALVYAPLAIPLKRDFVFLAARLAAIGFSWRDRLSLWEKICYLTGFRNAIREFSPDAIHVHRVPSAVPRMQQLLGSRIPVFLTHPGVRIHGVFSGYRRILTLRPEMRERLAAAGGIPLERIAVVPDPLASEAAAEQYGETCLAIYREELVAPEPPG